MKKDPRIRYAARHWVSRFVANGGDYHDFQRVTNHVEHWDDWCQTWSECGAMHEQLGASAEAAQHAESAAYHYVHAALAYHFGKFLFLSPPDQLRAAHDQTVSVYQKALPHVDVPGERVAIPYEGGATMYGILRTPAHRRAWPPVVILVPGLDAVKEELHQVGNDLLRRGMAVLAIDGPGQGEMEFDQPMRHDYEVAIGHAIDSKALAKLASFNLAGVMNDVRCPLLLISGRMGDPAPAEDAARMADEAGGAATLWIFEECHPDCDNIVYKQWPQRADWMHEQLYRLPPSQLWLP